MLIGYARVSTEDQNLDLQLDALRKAGCDVIHQERASGKAGVDRPVRDAVLRDLEAGDTLVVWKLDRAGRSIVELQGIVSDLERRGVKFRSLTENIDTSSAQGWLFFVLLAAFAEFERNQIVERTKAGKAARVANGQHPGGPRTYGFAPDRATVIGAEAKVLQDAAAHVLHGDRLAPLVDWYNTLEIPTKGGGRWNETTLRRMLLNPDLVPAILGNNVHDDLVRLFAPASQRQHLGAPASHLLSGILVCQCGSPMYTAMIRDRDGSRHEVYRCRKSYGGRASGCGKTSIRSDTVEDWMAEAAEAAVCSEWFTEALNARRAALLDDVSAADLDDMRAEIAELGTILGTRYGTDEHRARRDDLQARVRAATAKLMAAPELRELLDLPRTAEGWQQAWAGWDVEQQRRKLKLLLRKVTVKAVGKGTRFHRSRLDPDWRV